MQYVCRQRHAQEEFISMRLEAKSQKVNPAPERRAYRERLRLEAESLYGQAYLPIVCGYKTTYHLSAEPKVFGRRP